MLATILGSVNNPAEDNGIVGIVLRDPSPLSLVQKKQMNAECEREV